MSFVAVLRPFHASATQICCGQRFIAHGGFAQHRATAHARTARKTLGFLRLRECEVDIERKSLSVCAKRKKRMRPAHPFDELTERDVAASA